jgi:hypothetical protein
MPRQRAVRVVCTEYTHRSRLTKKRHTDDRPRIRIGIFIIIIAVPTRSLDFARRQCATDVCVRFARRLDRGRQTPFTPRSSPTPRERFDVARARDANENPARRPTERRDGHDRRRRPTMSRYGRKGVDTVRARVSTRSIDQKRARVDAFARSRRPPRQRQPRPR